MPTAGGSENRIFAQRFKTEQCRAFSEGKPCDYGAKCLFAHGPAEQRTLEQNLEDGLVSGAAVRRWQARCAQERGHSFDLPTAFRDLKVKQVDARVRSPPPEVEMGRPPSSTLDRLCSPSAVRQYRHDPYQNTSIIDMTP
jgi:hypothetical protein